MSSRKSSGDRLLATTPRSPKSLSVLKKKIVKEVVETFEQNPLELGGSFEDILSRVEDSLNVSLLEDLVSRREALAQGAFLYEQLGYFSQAKDMYKNLISLLELDDRSGDGDSVSSVCTPDHINWHLARLYALEGRYHRAESVLRELLLKALSKLHKHNRKGRESFVDALAATSAEAVTIDVLALSTTLAEVVTKQLYQSTAGTNLTSPLKYGKSSEQIEQIHENYREEAKGLYKEVLRLLSTVTPPLERGSDITKATQSQVVYETRCGSAHLHFVLGDKDRALSQLEECKAFLESEMDSFPSSKEEVFNWAPDRILVVRRRIVEVTLSLPNVSSVDREGLQQELVDVIREQDVRVSLSALSIHDPARLPNIERRMNLLDSMHVLAKDVYMRPETANWLKAELVLRELYERRSTFLEENHADLIETKTLWSTARRQLSTSGTVPLKGSFLQVAGSTRAGENTEERSDGASNILCGAFCF